MACVADVCHHAEVVKMTLAPKFCAFMELGMVVSPMMV